VHHHHRAPLLARQLYEEGWVKLDRRRLRTSRSQRLAIEQAGRSITKPDSGDSTYKESVRITGNPSTRSDLSNRTPAGTGQAS
jgi:hypothetical protein